MIRAVLDTNLLVSYLLTHRPPIATLIDHHLAQDVFMLVTAPELLAELDRVLAYPKLQRYYAVEDRSRFVALVMALSQVVDLPEEIPELCRDPDDDRVIACAVVGEADVIVSGDNDLLALEQVGDIPVLGAAQFLEMLEQGIWRQLCRRRAMKRKVKVDWGELAIALDTDGPELYHYLDLETGSVIAIMQEFFWDLEKIYAEIFDEEGKQLVTLEDHLQSRDDHDWQKEMILEANRVEEGYGTRYIRIEHDSRDDYRTMERFIGTVEDDDLRERMSYAIRGRGAFRRFKDILGRHPELRDEWFEFKNDRLKQRVADWLEDHDIEPV